MCNTSTGYSYKAALEDGSESECVPSNKSLNIYRLHVHVHVHVHVQYMYIERNCIFIKSIN